MMLWYKELSHSFQMQAAVRLLLAKKKGSEFILTHLLWTSDV